MKNKLKINYHKKGIGMRYHISKYNPPQSNIPLKSIDNTDVRNEPARLEQEVSHYQRWLNSALGQKYSEIRK